MEREIRHEVGDKYDELLSHATDIEGLEKSLQDTFSSVKALKVLPPILSTPVSSFILSIGHCLDWIKYRLDPLCYFV